MAKLPQTIYVVRRSESRADDYLLTFEHTDGFDDGEIVGTYQLVAKGTKRVRHSVEKK